MTMEQIKEILKRIKKLEIKTNKLVYGLISGNYRSVFKGRGIEFSEVREYIPGDDIRSIDWNVTARFDMPYVKEFIEERDLSVYIAFDVSASNNFGHVKSKKETGIEISASLMLAAMRNNDNIGLCLFTDRVEKFIRARKGRKHFLRLLREMVYYEPVNKKTGLNESLIYLSRILKRQCIIFVISDFISGDFEKPLMFLRSRHDVILIILSDIRESDIPDIGYILVEDEETGEQMIVNTSNADFREAYLGKIREFNDSFSANMRRLGIDFIRLNTSESFHVQLRRFFRIRERRMVR